MAEHLHDDFTLELLDQNLDDPFALTEEHLGEFCRLLAYLHGALERVRRMASDRAGKLIERCGLPSPPKRSYME